MGDAGGPEARKVKDRDTGQMLPKKAAEERMPHGVRKDSHIPVPSLRCKMSPMGLGV